jgi:GDP-D-mannose dehydratase
MRAPQASAEKAPESMMPGSGVLFSPKDARPGGDVLEAVAYWGDTVLDVDYFHPSIKGNEQVLIGDPTKAKEKLGWTLEYDLPALVKDMMTSDVALFSKK